MAQQISKYDIRQAKILYEDCGRSLEYIAQRFGVTVEYIYLVMFPASKENLSSIEKNDLMERLRKSGYTYKEIGEMFNMSQPGVYKALHPEKSTAGVHMKAIEVLGGKCARCGFDDIRALQIDHVNGGGRKDHRERGQLTIYRGIIKAHAHGENITDFQVLCANCNWIKRWENKETAKRKAG